MVHSRVESGMYQSASEVVREALRRYFAAEDQLTGGEIEYIKALVAPRLEAVRNGSAQRLDGDTVFAEMAAMLKE